MAKRKNGPRRPPRPAVAHQPAAVPVYNHKEAFCLMIYQCKLCGHRELIWNSRDGVTPFIILCRSCWDGEMSHIDWQNDRRVVDYIPDHGQWIFIDIPESLKAPFARARVEHFKGTPYEAKSEAEVEERVKGIIKSFKGGEPWLIQWR